MAIGPVQLLVLGWYCGMAHRVGQARVSRTVSGRAGGQRGCV